MEGEKTAEAAARLFPEYAVVTWAMGSKAVGKTDWRPLAGRNAVLFPDADEPGRKAMVAVRKALERAGASSVAIVDLPSGLPPGWDLADPLPPLFNEAAARATIEAARATPQEGRSYGTHGFRMDGDGLWFDQVTTQGSAPQRVSDPFDVKALARDHTGSGWGVIHWLSRPRWPREDDVRLLRQAGIRRRRSSR